MEVLRYHSPPSATRLKSIFSVKDNSAVRSLRFPTLNQPISDDSYQLKISSSLENSIPSNESCSSYVIDSEQGQPQMSQGEVSVAKVFIPGLPDEPNADKSAPISSCFWEWKPMLSVHYEKSGCDNVGSPPVLFLPGFGVGTFHYEKQLRDLGCDFRVWALDFLGQGLSLPIEDPAPLSEGDGQDAWGFGEEVKPWANELAYSIDLWKDQVRCFIEQVVGEPVFVVGNSLGGYVALYFAASHPELVKGVTLLNATPFWGFLPNPSKSPLLAKMFPWAGTFPLPANMKKIAESVWQKISDPRSITDVLKQVYAEHPTDFDKVYSKILETTKHPAAPAAFTSIMFAPRGELSFTESLSRCRENNIPICLMYGKEDPWVKPVWGRQVKKQVPDAPYYEISPAGHCPHDEVPEVVNYLLRGWIRNLETEGSIALPLLDGDAETANLVVTKDLEFVRQGLNKSVRVRFFSSPLSFWNWFRYSIEPYVKLR